MNETILYNFCSQPNCADGARPWFAGVIRDSAGTLYGTTWEGGAFGNGVVFSLDTSGTYTVLYNFCSQANCTDGSHTNAGVIRDAAGNLYGITRNGGNPCPHESPGCGVAFKLDASGNYTVLHTFCSEADCADGAIPLSALMLDSAGNLYGTASRGGASNGGVVFRLDPSGSETVLYNFCSQANCADGRIPAFSPLISDSAGNLYGTTSGGGASDHGVAFRLDPSGNEDVLHRFAGGLTDGSNPWAGVILDSDGNLYGTTHSGGASDPDPSRGPGVAYKLDSAGNETVLHVFCAETSCADGVGPIGGLIRDSAGNLYGTTGKGGDSFFDCGQEGCGVVFKLDTTGDLTELHFFTACYDCIDGKNPNGVISDEAGNLYGTTFSGGRGGGTVFKLER